MYSNAPVVQTYNPAAAAADGTAHQMHAGISNHPYYSLPGQQMSVPPGAPATMTGFRPLSIVCFI